MSPAFHLVLNPLARAHLQHTAQNMAEDRLQAHLNRDLRAHFSCYLPHRFHTRLVRTLMKPITACPAVMYLNPRILGGELSWA